MLPITQPRENNDKDTTTPQGRTPVRHPRQGVLLGHPDRRFLLHHQNHHRIMALKIDKDILDISTYTNGKKGDLSWWFEWCKDEDPQTFWDRRYEKRKAKQKSQ